MAWQIPTQARLALTRDPGDVATAPGSSRAGPRLAPAAAWHTLRFVTGLEFNDEAFAALEREYTERIKGAEREANRGGLGRSTRDEAKAEAFADALMRHGLAANREAILSHFRLQGAVGRLQEVARGWEATVARSVAGECPELAEAISPSTLTCTCSGPRVGPFPAGFRAARRRRVIGSALSVATYSWAPPRAPKSCLAGTAAGADGRACRLTGFSQPSQRTAT